MDGVPCSSLAGSSRQQSSGRAQSSIEEIREACLLLVRRRAWMAAAASFIPMPGVGMITDVAVLMSLIDETNTRFGLTETHIRQLSPIKKALGYRLLTSAGGMIAVRVSSSRLLGTILRRAGLRLGIMETARFAPVIGQMTAALIAYFTLTQIARRHVEQCVQLSSRLHEAV